MDGGLRVEAYINVPNMEHYCFNDLLGPQKLLRVPIRDYPNNHIAHKYKPLGRSHPLSEPRILMFTLPQTGQAFGADPEYFRLLTASKNELILGFLMPKLSVNLNRAFWKTELY